MIILEFTTLFNKIWINIFMFSIIFFVKPQDKIYGLLINFLFNIHYSLPELIANFDCFFKFCASSLKISFTLTSTRFIVAFSITICFSNFSFIAKDTDDQ